MNIEPALVVGIAIAMFGLLGTLIGILFVRLSHLEKRIEDSESYSRKLWAWAQIHFVLYLTHRKDDAPDPNPIPERN